MFRKRNAVEGSCRSHIDGSHACGLKAANKRWVVEVNILLAHAAPVRGYSDPAHLLLNPLFFPQSEVLQDAWLMGGSPTIFPPSFGVKAGKCGLL